MRVYIVDENGNEVDAINYRLYIRNNNVYYLDLGTMEYDDGYFNFVNVSDKYKIKIDTGVRTREEIEEVLFSEIYKYGLGAEARKGFEVALKWCLKQEV